jgi:hypothetical protein
MAQQNDYYEQLKKESYKALLDKEVQASIARDRAMKYTQASVSGSPYSGQGIGESTMVGITNNYQKALQDASVQHQQQLSNIATQQRQEELAAANDEFQSLTTLMNSATTTEELNDILNRYEITIGEENGVNTFNYGENNKFSDNDKRQLETIYNLYNNQLKKTGYEGREALLDGSSSMVTYTNEGNFNKDYYDFKHELKTLQNNVKTGNLPDGAVIRLDEKDHNANMFLIYVNGTFYNITPEEYINANPAKAYYITGYNNIVNKKDTNNLKY